MEEKRREDGNPQLDAAPDDHDSDAVVRERYPHRLGPSEIAIAQHGLDRGPAIPARRTETADATTVRLEKNARRSFLAEARRRLVGDRRKVDLATRSPSVWLLFAFVYKMNQRRHFPELGVRIPMERLQKACNVHSRRQVNRLLNKVEGVILTHNPNEKRQQL